ncbi:hypothetical protein CYLTODRAFT_423020 [Cylindrobasidium torrendii FP15055 ss-10]|uniref:SEC7 domain-containing protein n=1 Tax=Cylindrobasidium torrendii FP15055 ss-10 TaxID=1314674 RepID=A0A0D7B9G3_9AGAR|nr:hypothetical protein CYLTODRAFT_423020 [Cylindrobasidium torrendii FP15055 ss-10]
MEGGRRPRMHTEAVSEGEKGEDSRGETPDLDTPPPEPQIILGAEPERIETRLDALIPTTTNTAAQPIVAEYGMDEPTEEQAEPEVEEVTITRPPSRSRRRSRRRSKDIRNRSQTSTPTHGDSSPELNNTIDLSDAPALPTSSSAPFRMLRSPTPNAADPPRAMSPSASPVPGIPTLDDIRNRGLLQRSQSTASRQDAMAKLTGGLDHYDPAMSPSSGLRRNLTVSGDERQTAERTAARKQLFDRLTNRVGTKESEVEPTESNEHEPNSGEEQVEQPPRPPSSTRKRRRRSRSNKRGSASNPAVSDSDYITTSPSTPIPPSSPLPQTPLPSEILADWARAPTPAPNILFKPVTPSQSPYPYAQDYARASPLQFNGPSEPVFSPERHTPDRLDGERRIVVEDDEEDGEDVPSPFLPIRKTVTPPQRSPLNGSPIRVPHSSDAPSATSAESGLLGVPMYISESNTSHSDGFPRSPMQTPTKTHLGRGVDDDEEEVLFQSGLDQERDLSWVALPLEEYDDDVDEDVRPPSFQEEDDDHASVIIDSDPSPEIGVSQLPASPYSTTGISQSGLTHPSNDSISQSYPHRLSITERSPGAAVGEYTDTEERPESRRQGTWKRMKEFVRSGSSTGRRSRTNSVSARDRRDHTDSSISRESGGSLTSGRMDRLDSIFAVQQTSQLPIGHSPSASASVPVLSSAGQFSPVPMGPSNGGSPDFMRYKDPKLHPFPDLQQQAAQRREGMSPSPSTPDFHAQSRNDEPPISPLASRSQSREGTRSPTIGHQVSDTGMRIRYQNEPPPAINYIDLGAGNLENNDLPKTLGGVRRWMKVKNMFASGPISPDAASKKPSLSDLLKVRKDTEVYSDSSANGNTVTPNSPPLMTPQHSFSPSFASSLSSPRSPILHMAADVEQTPRGTRVLPPKGSTDPLPVFSPPTSSPPDPLSPTPDMSSASEYPAQTVSSSASSTSSSYSTDGGDRKAAIILQKLEENLARSSRSPMWGNAIERPRRNLVLSQAVLQVVNANTVKDRFLFLFTDMLVIAKPVNGHDGRIAQDQSFTVKSVVMLDQLKFTGDRFGNQTQKGLTYSLPVRNPVLLTFVRQFKKNPDLAISNLFSSLQVADDPALLGHLLFRTSELDRVQLGEYLSMRTSKLVLRSFLDQFAFFGLRLDRALRAFLLSVHVKDGASLSFLLDAFAVRWYEANAGVVAYNKSLAINLVHAIMRLNEHVHGGLAVSPGPSDPLANVHSRDFITAFRQSVETRGNRESYTLVSDDFLRDVFEAVLREQLCMAVATERTNELMNITIKRRLPEQLTYKTQSDPIFLRIPQPDAHLTIYLYGNGLVFDPPVLTFARSTEACFRVTGNSLGPKTFLMYRSGPSALKYTGLPLSCKVSVERAFMRHTFQVAFVNHVGEKRRYMFSMQDTIQKINWLDRAAELRKRYDESASVQSAKGNRLHRAIELMAFRALQDTLMGGKQESEDSGALGSVFKPNNHARSKSRSQVYHRQAGRHELELSSGTSDGPDDTADEYGDGRRVWTGKELVTHCEQNSSIGLFLSFLQVGPGHLEFGLS